MLAYKFTSEKHFFKTKIEEEIVGAFFIQNHQPSLGSHVANVSFAVKPDKNSKGQIHNEGLNLH